MFAQWWGLVQVQSAIFVQRLVTWDSEAFQKPTTAQTQTLAEMKNGNQNPSRIVEELSKNKLD
jgi:hypothetical protein